MNYLIIYEGEVYYAFSFDVAESYRDGMTVIDLLIDKYTSDGQVWWEIEEDGV